MAEEDDNILLETGDVMLLETGDKFLLESDVDGNAFTALLDDTHARVLRKPRLRLRRTGDIYG